MRRFGIVVVTLGILCCLSIAYCQEPKPEDLYKAALPSIATLTVENADGTQLQGSAFMAIREGLAVTAWHMVSGAKRVVAKFSNGEEFEVAGLVDKDEKRDVALIKVKVFGRPMLAMAPTEPPVGIRAYVVGAPLGLEFSISEGLVSQIQTLEGVRFYQFTCPASPGNSGGPLLNAKGKVLGVVSRQRSVGQNLNFAVPSCYALGLDSTLPTQPWVGAVPSVGGAVQDVVKAKRFEVIDDQGKTRATLGTLQDGRTSLWLYDAAGKIRTVLCVLNDGSPGLGLTDDAGRMRIGLAVGTGGSPGLMLYDATGKEQASLGTYPDDCPGLALYDTAGKTRVELHVAADGHPDLSLNDAAEKKRVWVHLLPDGTPGLVMGDAAGNMRAALAIKADGSSGLGLFDAAGKVLWQAP